MNIERHDSSNESSHYIPSAHNTDDASSDIEEIYLGENSPSAEDSDDASSNVEVICPAGSSKTIEG